MGAGELSTGLSDPSAFDLRRDWLTYSHWVYLWTRELSLHLSPCLPSSCPTPTVSFLKARDKSCPFGFSVLSAVPETQDMEFKSELNLWGSKSQDLSFTQQISIEDLPCTCLYFTCQGHRGIRKGEAMRRQSSQCLGHVNNILASSKRFP